MRTPQTNMLESNAWFRFEPNHAYVSYVLWCKTKLYINVDGDVALKAFRHVTWPAAWPVQPDRKHNGFSAQLFYIQTNLCEI